MIFKKLVCVDDVGLEDWAKEKLYELADEVFFYPNQPSSNEELLSRIQDADAVLVSWFTSIPGEIIRKCDNLKYIGMCSTLYDDDANTVDLKAAKEKKITVTGVRDYGDEGVAEFIISELIRLLKGTGKYQWKELPTELTNKKIGLIGMGIASQLMAHRALAFGMDVSYYSRTHKPEVEAKGILYKSLTDLVQSSEIISLHVPKNTTVLTAKEFDLIPNGTILASTSFGFTFDLEAFKHWIKKDGNYAIMDGDTLGNQYQDFESIPRVIATSKTTGWTLEAKERLSKKVIENLNAFR